MKKTDNNELLSHETSFSISDWLDRARRGENVFGYLEAEPESFTLNEEDPVEDKTWIEKAKEIFDRLPETDHPEINVSMKMMYRDLEDLLQNIPADFKHSGLMGPVVPSLYRLANAMRELYLARLSAKANFYANDQAVEREKKWHESIRGGVK